MRSRSQLMATLLGCSAFMALACPVRAQVSTDQTSPTDPEAAASADQAASDTQASSQEKPATDIVVTGSRIVQNGNNSPTPITVVDSTTLQNSTPATVADALDKLPAFGSSLNQRTTGNGESNAVGNFLNLRGLGTQRGLILFDGHRLPFTSTAGGVDVNTIPQFLLQRVEVVTGGASAVYGSDAVAGVVNFIVDNKFSGFKADIESGISSRGDNPTQKAGFAIGADLFGGRGHIIASYNYINSVGIDENTDRRNGAALAGLTGAGTAANPFRLSYNLRSATGSVIGLIRNGPLAGQQIGTGGVLVPFTAGGATGSAGIQVGGSGFYYKTPLLAGLRSHQGYTRLDYKVSDDVTVYAQGTFTKSHNDYPWVQYLLTNNAIFTNNPYLTPATQAALSSTGASTFTFSRILSDYAGQRVVSNTDSYFVNGGIKGKIGSRWNWDVSYTNAETRQNTDTLYNPNSAKLAAALDAVRAPSGQIVCQTTLTSPSRFPGCVPINVFGPGNVTPEALDFVTDRTGYTLTQHLDDASGTITGPLFDGWAGPIQVAANFEWRRNTLRNVSSAQPIATNCSGLRLACSALQYRANMTSNQSGSQEVWETAGEINVPLLRDVSFARSLSATGAVRYTHYDTSDGVTTWKVGGDWEVVDGVRFRVTRSRDIRAPNVYELFAAQSRNPAGFTDPHTGTAGIIEAVSGGNPDLTPEVANTFTGGVVLSPPGIRGLSLAIDYYQIKIKDAITSFGGVQAAPICEQSNGTSPLCSLVVRPLPFSDRSAANYPTSLLSQPINAASLKQSGIDTELAYRFDLAGGTLALRGLATYVGKQRSLQYAGAPNVDQIGTLEGLPRWKLAAFYGYSRDGFSVDFATRWRSSLVSSKDPRLVFDTPKIAAASFTDMTVSQKVGAFGGDARFYISVQNLFDKNPPLAASTTAIGVPGFGFPAYIGDDVVGRRYNAGVRFRF